MDEALQREAEYIVRVALDADPFMLELVARATQRALAEARPQPRYQTVKVS